ncbi:ASST-domain-containing protein [Aspergillus unguis]
MCADLGWYDLGAYGFGPSRNYVSFELESPLLEITESSNGTGCDDRYTFFAPRGDSVAHEGPVILDADGELVWKQHNWETTHDFKVQRYQGEDYLTYWEGSQVESRGYGSWYMLDATYTPRYVVNPVGNYGGDMHEFHITSDGTALGVIYDPTLADLTSVGGPEIGWLLDSLFQEIDIATGELIFEWRASEHFPLNSTYSSLGGSGNKRASAFDFFHLNSVDKDAEGNYLISARHSHLVACISRETSDILWILGGKANEFRDLSDGAATNFSWQHHARWRSDSTLTLFDNAAHSHEDPDVGSRGMVIDLDIPNREATLRVAYYHPHRLTTVSQGDVQILDDSGRAFVGWGHSAAYSEYSADGQLECNVHYGASAYFDFGRVVSYRIFKADWIGDPQSAPDAVVVEDTIFVSWNGATEVTVWQLETWDLESNDTGIEIGPLNLTVNTIQIEQYAKTGFETEIPVPTELESPFFRLAALDADGNVLGVTDPLQRTPESIFDKLGVWIIGIAFIAGLCGLVAALPRVWRWCESRRRNTRHRSIYQLVPFSEQGGTRSG